jgi:undecaprenyl diphosphate synthase
MLEKFSIKNKKNKEKNQTQLSIADLNQNEIPEHIAIIMDGNGRWAKKRGLPRMAGHHEGMKTVKKMVKVANQIGVKALTLYAFSTENWKRPNIEVEYLMKLPQEFLNSYLPELMNENVKVQTIGNKDRLPSHTLTAINHAVDETRNNSGLVLNFALNYGGRDDLIQATLKIINDVEGGKLDPKKLDEQLYSDYLMTKGLKEPELLIRTSGEMRLSNFMLWQLAYAEFVFLDVLWPDFTAEHFITAIAEYQNRGRRFGGL